MTRYLVTGGAGFIGSHLTESLLDDGHRVTILDDYSTGTKDNFFYSDAGGWQLNFIEHDVTEPLPVSPNFDTVIHLASIPTPGEYQDKPIQTLQTGSAGTYHTLELARQSDATYLFPSTSEVYGDPEEHPQTESYNGDVDPFGPRACYDESKRYSEALVRAYRDEHDLDIRIARIFNTYGPRMRDGRVIPTFVQQTLNGDALTIHGDGTQTRSFCYVDDLVRGLRELIQADVKTPVNLGNPVEVTINELADAIRDVTGARVPITHKKRPPDDPDRRRPDISKARELLDWSPRVSLRDGLRETAEKMDMRY